MNRKISICGKVVLKMMRKFALTVLNVVGRVISPESALQVRETGGTEEVRQSSVSCHGKPQYCIFCQTRDLNMLKTQKKEVVKMGQYQANLTPKEQKTLIGLIGKQNIVKLYMNDKPVDKLCDTGANISIISKEYVNDLFSNLVIKNLHDILVTRISCRLDGVTGNSTI